jgi:hypothetical protein
MEYTEVEKEEDKKDTVVDIELSYDKMFNEQEPLQEKQEEPDICKSITEFASMYNNVDTDANVLINFNFNDMYVRSNSPMASNCTSDIEQEHEDDEDTVDNHIQDNFSASFTRKRIHRNPDSYEYPETHIRSIDSPKKYKKFTYEDIEKSLSKYYDKTDSNFTETDLLVTYLKGMRMVYLISKNITHFKSYSIAMVTISITICLAVIAPFVKNMYWGAYLISSGNALATVLLSTSRFFKYDSNSAQYAFMEKQFSKLESRVENVNMVNNSSSQRFRDIESYLIEMNDYTQNLIPEEAVQLFPLIYRTNIIQFIRRTELHRRNLIIRFRDIKNEIHYILHKWNSSSDDIETKASNLSIPPQKEKERNRIMYLMTMKENTKTELLQCNHIYNQIDELFKNEIRYAETHQSCYGCSGVWKPTYDFNKMSPIVRDYLKLVIPD